MNIAQLQFFRYAATGIASNTAGYLLYLALTALGVDSKPAMTAVYVIGVAQSFVLNRHWTFEGQGSLAALPRYLVCHACGYGMNLGMLHLFADIYGLPHQYVQLAAVFVVAAFLFLLFRLWVFKEVTPQ